MVALRHYPIICRPFWTCEYFAVLTVEVEFFLELNGKHIHAPPKTHLNILIANELKACTCLPNMYTTHTRVVTLYKFIQ